MADVRVDMSYSFYIHSESGESAFLARRLEIEGHRVKLFVKVPRARDVGRGWVNRVNVFAPARSDIVIFDMVGDGGTADQLRRRGFKVIGGSSFMDVHEIDRERGQDLMRAVGISVPLTQSFTSVVDAKRFLNEQEDGGWYFKPAGNADASLTHGARDRADALRWLDYVGAVKGFELQRKVDGTEISLEGWFDGDKWVWPFNSTIEDKKFMPGDVGPNTGCMGNVVWAYKESRPILALKTIARLEEILREVRYCGAVDLNMIIDKEGEPQGLEWTLRFGYDALAALCMLNRGNLGEQLGDFAFRKLDSFEIDTSELAMTMRVSVPPYPNYEPAKEARDRPMDPDIMSDYDTVFPQDIMVRNGKPYVSGSDASVAVVGGRGRDVMAIRKKLLKRIQEFRIPAAQYRIDACERFGKVVIALTMFNYETPLEPGFSRRDMGVG